MKRRDKEKRKRMSLQNQDLRNKLRLADNEKEEEREVTEEEDPLKFFSQQEKKRRKEEEAKKYLLPITEEEDPLNFFDQENKKEAEQDPMKFLKNPEVDQGSKAIQDVAQNEEVKLAEALKNNDIPEEVVVNKKEKGNTGGENKQQKMAKRMKTAQKLSLRGFYGSRDIGEVLKRVKNSKNDNPKEAIKDVKVSAAHGNTLLTTEEQVDPAKNPQAHPQTKQVDLKDFMKKK